MLFKHKDFQETLVHQCSDAHKYITEHKQEIANVRRHDCNAYMVVGDKMVHIKYCPYCGINLYTDETTDEYLKIKLLDR